MGSKNANCKPLAMMLADNPRTTNTSDLKICLHDNGGRAEIGSL